MLLKLKPMVRFGTSLPRNSANKIHKDNYLGYKTSICMRYSCMEHYGFLTCEISSCLSYCSVKTIPIISNNFQWFHSAVNIIWQHHTKKSLQHNSTKRIPVLNFWIYQAIFKIYFIWYVHQIFVLWQMENTSLQQEI